MKHSAWWLAGVLLFVAACKPEPGVPAWSRTLPEASVIGSQRTGAVTARGIIHLHSPYSHDACDGEPRDPNTGEIDAECLAHLRQALCDTRMDFAALTEHDDSMADAPFEDLFLLDATDTMHAGVPAGEIVCANGHTTFTFAGGENDLMPILLDDHVAGDAQQRHDTYNGNDAAAVDAFHTQSATVLINHTERWAPADAAALDVDGVELYNLHANVDPSIRADDLGVDPFIPANAIGTFVAAGHEANPPEPDLVFVAFMEENQPALETWNALLAQRRALGVAGTDAHENTFPNKMRDGERGDSYRRMLRWFSNVVWVDSRDPAAIRAAIEAGRLAVVFEGFGTPTNLDFYATEGADTFEIGDDAPTGAALTLVVPGLANASPQLADPIVSGRIVHVATTGEVTVVAEGTNTVTATATDPGAYRAEVRIQPLHLTPYFGNLGSEYAERELVWVYTNPIYVP